MLEEKGVKLLKWFYLESRSVERWILITGEGTWGNYVYVVKEIKFYLDNGNYWLLLSTGEIKLDFCFGRIIDEYVEDELEIERFWFEIN